MKKNEKIAFIIGLFSLIILAILFRFREILRPTSTYIFYIVIYLLILSLVISSKEILLLIKDKKILQNIMVFFNTLIIVILVIELFSFTLIVKDEYPEYIVVRFKKEEIFPYPVLYKYNKDIGYVGIPQSKYNHLHHLPNGSLVFNVTYSLDEYGRRKTPDIDSQSSIVLFGGSYAFGHGLEDNETLGYYLSKETNKKVYMYAYQGQGPHQMLAQLEREDFEDEIIIPPKIGLYLYIPDHINRVIGDMHIYNEWGYDMPYYYLKDDELIRKGSFSTGRKITSFFYKFLGKSLFIKYYDINLPFRIDDRDRYLTARIIKESQDLFESRFDEKFYVIIMPSQDEVNSNNSKFVEILENLNVNVLDYDFEFDPEIHTIQDGHPKERFNKDFSKSIKEKIK